MAEKIVVLEALTLEGIVYEPAMEVPNDVWLRLPARDGNKLLHTAKVERRDE